MEDWEEWSRRRNADDLLPSPLLSSHPFKVMPIARLILLTAALFSALPTAAQVPTPESHFGFTPGEHRRLANWDELTAYYDRVATASDRVTIDTLGATTRGLPLVMFTITSPRNHARLDELRQVHLRLADPRTIESDDELDRLRATARTIVLITAHVHSTEVGAGQMPANLVHRLATSDDPEILAILDQVVILFVPSLNPDGTQLVTDWYRRWVGTEYEGVSPPELYHHYIGHDNNRDWYAFTQVETELTVEKAHNAWRPMIVHDVHQMGSSGARIFVPPYVEPFEPNVDPLIVTAINQLGSYMAAEMTTMGLTGVVSSAQYDLFTPARAYQHYHGGVRILSETASARLASPIVLAPSDLSNGRGFEVNRPSMNFPAPWTGGEWGLPQIVRYQEAAAMALLKNAARNRAFWVDNFVEIGRRAVRKWESWPDYWVIPPAPANPTGLDAMLRVLTMGSVEVHRATEPFSAGDSTFPAGSFLIPMRQPYASWAQAMLEVQSYPDLRDYPGGPPTRPYDVTAHTLPLLMGVEARPVPTPAVMPTTEPLPPRQVTYTAPPALTGSRSPRIGLYRGSRETMAAGWTRWLLDRHAIDYASLSDADIRAGALGSRFDVILLQDQSPAEVVGGWRTGEMPEEFTGGIGPMGAAALRDFVESGGRIVAVEGATEFVIDLLGLPVTNRVAALQASDFYIPGAILSLEVDPDHPIDAGTPEDDIAWFWRTSRAFDVRDQSVRPIAWYGLGETRLSGWVLGESHIAGQPAILEADHGRGSVVLFGFQPNYRGQSIATWPLLFNALAGD